MKNTDQKQMISLDLKLNTIQAIRILGTILESDYEIKIAESSRQIVEHLEKYFPIQYSIGAVDENKLNEIYIDHKTPRCIIGKIERPLIFPRSMVEFCEKKWQAERKYAYFFSGLMTEKRLNCLFEWVTTHNKNRIRKFYTKLILNLMSRQVSITSDILKKGLTREFTLELADENSLSIILSTKGRIFPEKAWDDDYYNQMASSKFVLCPNGDFIWTYRFFEAIFCGAIPIVEDNADIYNGYIFYKMSDPIEKYKYSRDIAFHNFHLAREILTLSREQVNSEISRIFEDKYSKK